MHDFLKFLNDEDRRLLAERAEQVHFEPGEVILREGERRHALFFIRSGDVRVERSHAGFDIEIARLEAGEIFGEMSMVEDIPASASVVADGPVDIEIISDVVVRDLIKGNPGFFGRFFRSVAYILSQRLRAITQGGFVEYARGKQEAEAGALATAESAGGGEWRGGSPLRDETWR